MGPKLALVHLLLLLGTSAKFCDKFPDHLVCEVCWWPPGATGWCGDFLKLGSPIASWFAMENPTYKWMNLGDTHVWKPPYVVSLLEGHQLGVSMIPSGVAGLFVQPCRKKHCGSSVCLLGAPVFVQISHQHFHNFRAYHLHNVTNPLKHCLQICHQSVIKPSPNFEISICIYDTT